MPPASDDYHWCGVTAEDTLAEWPDEPAVDKIDVSPWHVALEPSFEPQYASERSDRGLNDKSVSQREPDEPHQAPAQVVAFMDPPRPRRRYASDVLEMFQLARPALSHT